MAWFFWFSAAPLKLAVSPLDFQIPAGSSLRGVSQLLPAAGVGISACQFELLARLKGRDAQIKAGSYEIEQGVTPAALLDKLTRGDVSQSEVAFIEGWTFRQMREALEKNPYLIHESSGLSNAEGGLAARNCSRRLLGGLVDYSKLDESDAVCYSAHVRPVIECKWR